MWHILFPFALVDITVTKAYNSRTTVYLIIPVTIQHGSIHETESAFVWHIVGPYTYELTPIHCKGTSTITMPHVAQKAPFIPITLPVNHHSIPIYLVVVPLALKCGDAIGILDGAHTMFESILKLSSIEVSTKGCKCAIAFHLTFLKVAFVDVSIDELETALPCEFLCSQRSLVTIQWLYLLVILVHYCHT